MMVDVRMIRARLIRAALGCFGSLICYSQYTDDTKRGCLETYSLGLTEPFQDPLAQVSIRDRLLG